MSFELNFQRLCLLDITPETTATYARLGKGIQSLSPASNENIDQTTYLDGDGFGESEVIGAQWIYTAAGHRYVGDDAQDFIFAKQFSLGEARKTNFKEYDSQGNLISGACTIANVTQGGGDAQAKNEIGFEIHMNGKPEYTPAAVAPLLTVTVAAGSAPGTTKFTATAGAGNSLAYRLAAAVPTVYANQYVIEDTTAYTSGDNIAASVGQVLCMYELDAYGRVVKFASDTLASGDFPA
jgi:hypothetical protein